MLINSGFSRILNGRCPICGAANCACGGPSNVIAVDERVTRAGRGPLRSYPIGRGASIQLEDEMARARGFLPKKAEPVLNKKRVQAPNKAGR